MGQVAHLGKLTKSNIDAAAHVPGKAQTLLYDLGLKGFGLRITRTGVKSFIVEYRTKEGDKHRQTIGRYGVLTPDQARKHAKRLLADVAQGKNPAAERRNKKAELKVTELLDRFLIGHVIPNNKPSTRYEEERIINRLIRPQLGGLRLSTLSTARVKAWHAALVGTPPTANRALAHLQRGCRFAIEHGLIATNPCHGITRFKEKAKERFFSDAELKRIGHAIRDLVADNSILPSAGLGIRLIALTGLRANEARLLRWDDFDVTREVLYLADAKAGARSVPLFDQAVDLLKNAARVGPFIVAGFDPEKPIAARSFATAFEKVLGRAKITGASLHTLRHTLATYMAQHGDSVPLIAAAGGWRTLSMVQRYVTMHSVGKAHSLPAGQRIAMGLAGGETKDLHLPIASQVVPEKADPTAVDAISSTEKPKSTRGRPKMPWEPFSDELQRRFASCEARETVEEEAAELHKWGINQGLHVKGQKPSQMIGVARIRNRINKRHGGSAGYQTARAWHRLQNGCDAE